jgi:methionyl aminopeptidase
MVGRNDPCYCGSGKKYKKCHMKSDLASGKTPPEPEVNTLIKSSEEIEKMRLAGAFNGELMEYIRQYVKIGTDTEKINSIVHEYTLDNGHIPATLNYGGFPKSCCTSINSVVCHGIPSKEEIIQNGDIINVDLTTIVNGYFGDQSETFMLGDVTKEAQKLVTTTAEATIAAINAVGPGLPLSIVGDTIAPIIKKAGFSVVRTYTGHGIGSEFHENITVLHHKNVENQNIILEPGMTFTIEPMINAGNWGVFTSKQDGWTVYSKDKTLSAQFEHTLLITETGREVLTLTPSQRASGEIIHIPEVIRV